MVRNLQNPEPSDSIVASLYIFFPTLVHFHSSLINCSSSVPYSVPLLQKTSDWEFYSNSQAPLHCLWFIKSYKDALALQGDFLEPVSGTLPWPVPRFSLNIFYRVFNFTFIFLLLKSCIHAGSTQREILGRLTTTRFSLKVKVHPAMWFKIRSDMKRNQLDLKESLLWEQSNKR